MGPGTYQTESFTDELAKKVTSLRGPYDLFTGDRNATIKTGHLAKAVSKQYFKNFNNELLQTYSLTTG